MNSIKVTYLGNMIESNELKEPMSPDTAAPNMEYIRFSVPAALLEQANEMARAEGWKPAEFYRVVWTMGLGQYAEDSNKRLINKRLRAQVAYQESMQNED